MKKVVIVDDNWFSISAVVLLRKHGVEAFALIPDEENDLMKDSESQLKFLAHVAGSADNWKELAENKVIQSIQNRDCLLEIAADLATENTLFLLDHDFGRFGITGIDVARKIRAKETSHVTIVSISSVATKRWVGTLFDDISFLYGSFRDENENRQKMFLEEIWKHLV